MLSLGSTRMWNGAPERLLTNVLPVPQSRLLAMCPPQASSTVSPSALNVTSICRSTVPGVFAPIGVGDTYAASVRTPPQAEKLPVACPPLGNVVFSSGGTTNLLGSLGHACSPVVPATPSHGTTFCPSAFSLPSTEPR